MKCRDHTEGCGLTLKIGDLLYVDAGECIYFKGIWFVSVRRLDEHGNRGCKVGYVKVIADRIDLVRNRLGIVKSMHKHNCDVLTNYTSRAITRKQLPPRTTRDNGEKNGITQELAYCAGDYALITLLDGGVPAYRPNPSRPGPPTSDPDSSDDDLDKKPPAKKRKAADDDSKNKLKNAAPKSAKKPSSKKAGATKSKKETQGKK